MEVNNCVSCLRELDEGLDALDAAPMGAVCAKCRAEQKHDFDAEPDAEFDRLGRQIEKA